jgi:hypothetical protein
MVVCSDDGKRKRRSQEEGSQQGILSLLKKLVLGHGQSSSFYAEPSNIKLN